MIDALAEYRTSLEPIIYCSALYNVIIAGSYSTLAFSPFSLARPLVGLPPVSGRLHRYVGQANESAYRLAAPLIAADSEGLAAIMEMYVSMKRLSRVLNDVGDRR